ncbi:thiamine-phosphate kinase [Desulfothermus sp.]
MSKNKDTFFSEEDFLNFLDGFFEQREGLVLGRGDDCAIIKAENEMLISSDLFLEGFHFDIKYFPPYAIGYKVLAVNISDILAMGGIPIGFTMCLMINKKVANTTFFRDFFSGMASLCKEYNLYLAGGDISFSNFLGIDITIFGKKGKRCLYRKRANVGDFIFITGDIGLSRAGLYAFKMGIQDRFKIATKSHLMPKISYNESRAVTKNPFVNSLMDVSDGVLKDIVRLVPEGMGANLEIDNSMLHPEVISMAEILGEDPAVFAAKGGEDYVLMGTIKPDGIRELNKDISGFKVIGEVTDDGKFLLNGRKIQGGFDHFRYTETY